VTWELYGERIGARNPIFFIAGPCVIESRDHALQCADRIAAISKRLGVRIIYKSSFDKANRSSVDSFRGLGLVEGLDILREVKRETGLLTLTDVHTPEQAPVAASAVDVLQTPAFLARQTDFIQAVAATGKPVNIKKAQFMAPDDMANVAAKAKATGNDKIMLCERGTSFGYKNLVVDMRGLQIMQDTGLPVIFDATHSVQLPSANGQSSGGERRFVPNLARAAVASGVAGVFMETHPDPSNAPCDGPNAWPLDHLEKLLLQLIQLDAIVKSL
jgi:2-dehydro-3-deoxyphosphooctonate aldolase (KDO 8-P synthase)